MDEKAAIAEDIELAAKTMHTVLHCCRRMEARGIDVDGLREWAEVLLPYGIRKMFTQIHEAGLIPPPRPVDDSKDPLRKPK